MISYIIKSGLCLALILLVYKLFLERERMYVFNRYYLIFGLCFSIVVPLITMETIIEVPSITDTSVIPFDTTNHDALTPIDITPVDTSARSSWVLIAMSLYIVGYLLFFLRFMKNIYHIFYKITRNVKTLYKKASLVLLKEHILPHTFLHYIFIEKEAYESENIAEELYIHELAHVTQKHTLDILLIELIQIVFWFNPLVFYYKKAIQLNHEFLADDAVIKSNTAIPTYQRLLLDNANWNHNLHLASNLNFSVTKKRLQMMTKHTSRARSWLFAMLTIPFFIGALFLFSTTKVIAKETNAEIIEIPVKETIIQKDQDPKANYYKYATFILEDEQGNKTKKTYAELTEKEKAMLLPPPPKPAANRPTDKQLNDWKNKKKFAIWLDGKVIENNAITQYEIIHYTGSFVHKNARSKRFPQLYQMHLYTATGFKDYKQEIIGPLNKGAILHIKKGKQRIKHIDRKKVGQSSREKKAINARKELAEINKLPLNYVNESSGPNETTAPYDNEKEQHKGRKDIVIFVNKKGEFLINYDHTCKLDQLDKYIKLELGKILHKRARTALIIYDGYAKDQAAIINAKKVLTANKIHSISVMSSADIPPPPPPPAPKKAPKVIEVIGTKNVSEERAKSINIMHKIIKGQKLETMMINGKKHYYVIKNGRKFIFNEDSQLVNKDGIPLPPPPPPAPEKVTMKKRKVAKPQKASKAKKASKKTAPNIIEVPEKQDAPKTAKTLKKSSEWKDVKYFLEEGKNAGTYTSNGKIFYYVMKDGKRILFNRFGERVDNTGKVIKPVDNTKK